MCSSASYQCTNLEWQPAISLRNGWMERSRDMENLPELIPALMMKQEPGSNSSTECPSRQHFRCFFCDARFDDNRLRQRHQDNCDQRAEEMKFILLDRQNTATRSSRVEKRTFLESFNLITTGKAEMMCQAMRAQVECDVIVVDDSDDDSEIDESTAFPASLSDAAELVKSPRKFIEHRGTKRKRSGGVSVRKPTSNRLLKIDICSPLGVRLKQHVVSGRAPFETCPTNIISGFYTLESYLNRTATHDGTKSSDSVVLSHWRSLHNRRIVFSSPSFPVTFHQAPRLEKHCHRYKFSRRHRAEFCRTIDTGLNARARHIRKSLKPSFVKLERLCLESLERIDCSTCAESGSLCERSVCEDCRFSTYQFESLYDARLSDDVATDCESYGEDGGCEAAVGFVDRASSLRISIRRTACKESNEWYVVDDQKDADLVGTSSPESNDFSENGNDGETSIKSVDTEIYAEPDVEPPLIESSELVSSSASGLSKVAGEQLLDMWSSSDCLPPLSFLCGICNLQVECAKDSCAKDSRVTILSHYASHGITNISLIMETLPNGEIALQLVELPEDEPPPILQREDMVVSDWSAKRCDDALPSAIDVAGGIGEQVIAPNVDKPVNSLSPLVSRERKRVSWNDQHVLSYPDSAPKVKKFKQSPPSQSSGLDRLSHQSAMPELPYHGVHCSPSGFNWISAPNYDYKSQKLAVPQQLYCNHFNNGVCNVGGEGLVAAESPFARGPPPYLKQPPTPFSPSDFLQDAGLSFYNNEAESFMSGMPKTMVNPEPNCWTNPASFGFVGYHQNLDAPSMKAFGPTWDPRFAGAQATTQNYNYISGALMKCMMSQTVARGQQPVLREASRTPRGDGLPCDNSEVIWLD